MVNEHPNLASFHAMITGMVQGVYFRAYVEHHAQALGLTGYVRNVTHSGAVEVEAEGEKANLEQLIQYLHQGPRAARVEKVNVQWRAHTGRYADFSITL
jgi:acylphosphatase